MRTTTGRLVAALLLAMHAALLAWMATRHSPVLDETGHLPAGLCIWEFGRTDIYPVNPPLVKAVAAFPVWCVGYESDWELVDFDGRVEFELGRDFVEANGSRSFLLFTVARWACIPFSVLGGLVCWSWATQLYGPSPGRVALILWCFSPHILGNAGFILPDVAAASLGTLACWLFWRWLHNASWSNAVLAGMGLGLANTSKLSWVVLYFLWPMLALFWLYGMRPRRWSRLAACVVQLVAIVGISIGLTNAAYGFSGSLTALGEFEFNSSFLSGREVPESLDYGPVRTGNRFRGSWLERLPVPLPVSYVRGFDLQKRDFERQFFGYLRGEHKEGGWWYYYLYGLGVKTPIGTLTLAVLAGLTQVASVMRSPEARSMARDANDSSQEDRRITWRDECILLAPAVVILALVSSQSGINMFLRYVIPVVPFMFIWMSKLARDHGVPWQVNIAGIRWNKWIVGTCLLASVASSLWYYPHSASFFNGFVGGPLGGPKHLIDANIGWGQDLLYLKQWYDAHPDARPLGLAYFGNIDARVAGIEFQLPPRGSHSANLECRIPSDQRGPLPGWYAVDVSFVMGLNRRVVDGHGEFTAPAPNCDFRYFQRFKPVDRAGYSIYIYHITRKEANAVRKEIGIPPISDR